MLKSSHARAFIDPEATMILLEEKRIDWFRLLADLKAEGWTLSSVAYFTGIPKANLSGYKAGSQPSYHYGAVLLAHWSQCCGKEQADAPATIHKKWNTESK